MMQANIADLVQDDLDIIEAVVLDHITAILCVSQQSAGESLTRYEAEACIDHFSIYIEWKDVAVEREFQALTQAKAPSESRGDQGPEGLCPKGPSEC